MVDFVPSEKGVTIRYPSTAQLCIDTADRKDPYVGTPNVDASSPFDCQFIQKQNILNGFFTRFSTTEITLEWAEPNIIDNYNDRINAIFDVPITGNVSASGTNITITTNNYLAIGNSVTLSGLTGAGAVLNGVTGSVASLTGSNPSTQVILSATSSVVASGSYGGELNVTLSAVLAQGFYNVAQLLDTIVCEFNVATGTTTTNIWSIDDTCGNIAIKNRLYDFVLDADLSYPTLLFQLGLQEDGAIANSRFQYVICPDIRLYRFLDFTCPQLTYAQDVKDATTNPVNVDSLARFYMAYDAPPQIDKYGFSILLGYNPTTIRRAFNPPKQIKWENGLPVGNLNFKVYGSIVLGGEQESVIAWSPSNPTPTNWLMTIQVSEV
jgi:hypothetical protein